jgi:hypothetical protein
VRSFHAGWGQIDNSQGETKEIDAADVVMRCHCRRGLS